MLKFNEDAIKKDVEETLALRKDVEAAVKKICEKGYNNIFLVGIGGTYAVAEELMSYLKGHSKIEIYLENAADRSSPLNRVTFVSFSIISSVPWKKSAQEIDFVRIHSISSM